MIANDTIKACVIGWPVSHSLSPRLHGYWLQKHNINGTYEALPVEPEKISCVLRTLKEKGFSGANITVPHKETVLKLLPQVDETARKIGAVNTIINENGKWRGTNTDAFGFMESLRMSSDLWKDGLALVLGAGGAARAVSVGLLDEGFDVVIANRSIEKADAVRNHINNPRLRVIEWEHAEAQMNDASLVVNTTTLGMKGQPLLNLSLHKLSPDAYVADIVYNPEPTERTRKFSNPTITDFLARAAQNGNQVVDGLGMLLYQAQAGFEMWCGVRPEVTRALRSHVLEGLFHEASPAQ